MKKTILEDNPCNSTHNHHHHDEHHHGHHHIPNSEKKMAIAAILTGGFMLIEGIGGIFSGSLALLADAGHMLTDFASLILAWLALRLSHRPADLTRTYGFDRFSVLAAFVNGLSLFVIAIWITYEAIKRIFIPEPILGGTMLWIAASGLFINIIVLIILTQGEKDNLNVKAAILHVAGDLLGSISAIIAAIVIIFTDWTLIDPILSILVTVIILKAAWGVVRESGHILLEGTPKGFDKKQAETALNALDGVLFVHHIHAWSVTQERPMATLEMTIKQEADSQTIKNNAKKLLANQFGINHATIEITRENNTQKTRKE